MIISCEKNIVRGGLATGGVCAALAGALAAPRTFDRLRAPTEKKTIYRTDHRRLFAPTAVCGRIYNII